MILAELRFAVRYAHGRFSALTHRTQLLHSVLSVWPSRILPHASDCSPSRDPRCPSWSLRLSQPVAKLLRRVPQGGCIGAEAALAAELIAICQSCQ